MGRTRPERSIQFGSGSRHCDTHRKDCIEKYAKPTNKLRCSSGYSIIIVSIHYDSFQFYSIPFYSEALDVILLHSTSTQSILNRKAITKENLFKYLHGKKVAVTSEFTKQLLIEKILQHWKQSYYLIDDDCNDDRPTNRTSTHIEPARTLAQESASTNAQEHPESFPINQMARTFATWFYENLNTNRLQVSDFWCNCECSVQFWENRQCLMEEQHSGAQAVLEFCQSLLSKYNLYLNLNISHSGSQGRIDCHGLVLVLTCGTLHKVNEFVGTFEAIFGLSRDPYSQNNWKVNRSNFRLNNINHQSVSMEQPTLVQSELLAPLLSLSMPNGDDEIR